jgi:DNA mismatch repair protein MutS
MALLPPGVHEHFPQAREQLTPLFKQYCAIKDAHPQGLLLYRLGDFYEMFGPDAAMAAELLGLTLTSRSCAPDYKVAMCGVPYHSAARYIKRLVDAGVAAAICEQTEDPAQAKGLVERQVTRVITAGTLVEDEYLSAEQSNFLVVLAEHGAGWGIALLESSGGAVELIPLPGASTDPLAAFRFALSAALRHYPAEVLIPETLHIDPAYREIVQANPGPVYHTYPALPPASEQAYFLERYFKASSLGAFGIEGQSGLTAALFALVRYLRETFAAGELALRPRLSPLTGQLYLDSRTAAHLELTTSQSGGQSLYSLLCHCRTALGKRLFKRWLLAPCADADELARRQDSVAALIADSLARAELCALLDTVQDVERIVNRVQLGRSHPKEVRALVNSLPALTELGARLSGSPVALLAELADGLGRHAHLHSQWDALLADDPPVKPSDGSVIRPGADSEVDRLRELHSGSCEWFAAFEEQERERTGIRSLKVKQTGPFGYFIEVSKANLALVPVDYQRKQTLVNAERFTTAELAQREQELQTAEARLLARESELFASLCQAVTAQAGVLAQAAQAAAQLDVLAGLSAVAQQQGWVRTELDTGAQPVLDIEGGAHPLVEHAVGARYYTKNDCYLAAETQQVLLLTGPNMGGKSTYLRMAATLAVLNQLAGHVPAQRARLPLFDRIYTRIGAQDHLSRGQSTFMVEMVETAEILNTCSEHSLVVLDEVGRGTSTYDGISIAKAVLEYLHEHPARPLTLFATHFFELTDLASLLPRVANFQVDVAREGGRFVFLYRVSPGCASDSFGVEVAALAGLPEAVVARARAILAELEEVQADARARARKAVQLGLFGEKR